MKTCSACGFVKPLDEFYGRPDGYRNGRCKACVRTASAAYYKKHRTRQIEQMRIRKYGVSDEDYEILLARQKGRCAICGTTTPSRQRLTFDVDHDHKTDVVRGLLCSNCNRAIGLMNDDVDALRKAANYLERYESV